MDLAPIYRLRLFTLAQFASTLSVPLPTASVMLQRLKKRGVVKTIRRDTYCVTNPATGDVMADAYEIGSGINNSAYISYHSALEFHGMAQQPFYDVLVTSDERFRCFSFGGMDFRWCAGNIGGVGVVTPVGNPLVRVTDRERTIVDCADRIDRAGGVEELTHSLEGLTFVDEDKLVHYLALYNKAFLYQKVGFLLERIKGQAGISDAFIAVCRDGKRHNVKWMANDDVPCIYVKEWGLYVPKTLKEECYELV